MYVCLPGQSDIGCQQSAPQGHSLEGKKGLKKGLLLSKKF